MQQVEQGYIIGNFVGMFDDTVWLAVDRQENR